LSSGVIPHLQCAVIYQRNQRRRQRREPVADGQRSCKDWPAIGAI
jgi:hypothetical protein